MSKIKLTEKSLPVDPKFDLEFEPEHITFANEINGEIKMFAYSEKNKLIITEFKDGDTTEIMNKDM